MISFTSQQTAKIAANQRSSGGNKFVVLKKKNAKSWLLFNTITQKVFDVNGELRQEDKIDTGIWDEVFS